MATTGDNTSIPVSDLRGRNLFVRIENRTSNEVQIQLLQDNITTTKTQAVVVFRSSNGTAEGDSLRVLQAAGDDIETEYQNAKAKKGSHVTKGVVLTGAGNLQTHCDTAKGDSQAAGDGIEQKQQHILHLLVDGNTVKFKETFVAALRLADKEALKSVAFPPLPYRNSGIIKTMLECVDEFTTRYHPMCLHFIKVVVTKNDEKFTEYEEEFKLYTKHINRKAIDAAGPENGPEKRSALKKTSPVSNTAAKSQTIDQWLEDLWSSKK